MKKIVLYGYATSPFVMKVGCFLKYKQLEFDHIPVNPLSPKQIKFTGQRQVPVLTIGEEWRKDSSPLGIWLDEQFPERSILPEIHRDEILSIDAWVSNQLIPARFRAAVEWENTFDSIRNGWVLSTAVNSGTAIPGWVRFLWPFFVRKAKFIVEMVNELDLTESMQDMKFRLRNEFLEHLGDGPFLGGLQQPSLADLSAYPTLVSGYLMGMRGKSPMLEHPEIIAWVRSVQSRLPDNPLLVADELIKRKHL